MSEFSKEQAEKEHQKRTEDFSKDDVGKVIDEEEKILNKFETKGKLKRYLDDAMILFSLG